MQIKIKAKDENKHINILLPTSLVCSNLTAIIAHKAITSKVEKEQFSISRKDLARIMWMLRSLKKKYGKLELVDIVSADGDIVKISL